jgi:hypothetical protein
MRPRSLALALGLGFALACVSEERMEEEFAAANYCDTADDCLEISPGCPLGCVRLINRAEEAKIRKLIERYHEQHAENCAYDCTGIGPIRCEGGECLADPL